MPKPPAARNCWFEREARLTMLARPKVSPGRCHLPPLTLTPSDAVQFTSVYACACSSPSFQPKRENRPMLLATSCSHQFVDRFVVKLTAKGTNNLLDSHRFHHSILIFLMACETVARALSSEDFVAVAISSNSRPPKYRRCSAWRCFAGSREINSRMRTAA